MSLGMTSPGGKCLPWGRGYMYPRQERKITAISWPQKIN